MVETCGCAYETCIIVDSNLVTDIVAHIIVVCTACVAGTAYESTYEEVGVGTVFTEWIHMIAIRILVVHIELLIACVA